jgi:hypothetical protein
MPLGADASGSDPGQEVHVLLEAGPVARCSSAGYAPATDSFDNRKGPGVTRAFFATESAKLRLAATVSYRRFGPALSNVFVIRLIGGSRTIANNEVKV